MCTRSRAIRDFSIKLPIWQLVQNVGEVSANLQTIVNMFVIRFYWKAKKGPTETKQHQKLEPHNSSYQLPKK